MTIVAPMKAVDSKTRDDLPPGGSIKLLVDGHVHVHPGYNQEAFLTNAVRNLSRYGDGLPTLLLAETASSNVFAAWRKGNAPWSVQATDEQESLFLGSRILVIAGRQIVTAEKVEVLALLTDQSFADGLPLEQTLDAIARAKALAVLPWGVGKWLGNRGRIVAEAVSKHNVLLGDNAGRPTGWPAPKVFGQRPVLPGTDPLWPPSQEAAVGTFGFVLPCDLDVRSPARSLGVALCALGGSPSTFGGRVGPIGFVRQQVGLRLKP